MSNLRKAAQQALEVMESLHRTGDTQVFDMYGREATEALRAALDWPDITITGTYEEFIEFVNMACLHETIYDDSEGRQILVIRMIDAYGMAHSWALEHTRNNLS